MNTEVETNRRGVNEVSAALGLSRRSCWRLFRDESSDGDRHPLGKLMWTEVFGSRSSERLCIDSNDVLDYFNALREQQGRRRLVQIRPRWGRDNIARMFDIAPWRLDSILSEPSDEVPSIYQSVWRDDYSGRLVADEFMAFTYLSATS